MRRAKLIFCVLMVILPASLASAAAAKPKSKSKPVKEKAPYHEDLFGEKSIVGGFKVGPQISGYTPIELPSQVVNVRSSVRYSFGGLIKFNYEYVRIELDLFWNARGGVNSSNTLYSIATPLLAKVPITFGQDGLGVEVGGGFQPDFILFGDDPHRRMFSAAVAAASFFADFAEDTFFDFELRYVHGVNTVHEAINGAKPREFQMLGGLSFKL